VADSQIRRVADNRACCRYVGARIRCTIMQSVLRTTRGPLPLVAQNVQYRSVRHFIQNARSLKQSWNRFAQCLTT